MKERTGREREREIKKLKRNFKKYLLLSTLTRAEVLLKVPSELLGQHEYSPTSAGVTSVSMNWPSVVFAI